LTSNILMPIGGITIAIFAAWIFGGEEMKRVLTNEGALDNAPLARIMVNLMKYVTPVLVLIILLKGLNIF
ncbi:MAG: sodium-dependent transporter, partial [Bacteroidota bacterium]